MSHDLARAVRLRFADDETEAEFRRAFDRLGLAPLRLAAGLAILLYAGFGALDVVVAPQDAAALLTLRGTIIVLLAFVIWLSFRPVFARVQQAVAAGAIVVTAYGVCALPLVSDTPSSYVSTGTLVVLIFLFGFTRTRFVPAAIATVLVITGYEVSQALQDISLTEAVYSNSFLAAFVLAGLTTTHTLERLRRHEYLHTQALRNAFGSYVSGELVEEVASGETRIAAREVDVTVLFLDVRDFTRIAESSTAGDVVELLNELYAVVLPIVRRHGGHANKLLGDGLLACFGAPSPLPDHADRALEAASEMLHAVWAGFDGELRIGIGISSGVVVAGTIGGEDKLDYTLIGDAVNVAARVEKLTKQLAAPVLLTGDTAQRLRRDWALEPQGAHPLRGRSRAIALFALSIAPEDLPMPRASASSRAGG